LNEHVPISDSSRKPQDDGHEVFNRLVFIPLVFIFVRIWGSINRMYEMITDTQSLSVWLDYFQTVGDTSQGWINCVFFVIMSKRVRERYIQALVSQWKAFLFFATGHKGRGGRDNDESSSIQVYDHVSVRSTNPSKGTSLQDALIDPENLDEEGSRNST